MVDDADRLIDIHPKPICLCDLTDHAARHAISQRVGRDITGHHASGANDSSAANGHARADDASTGDPHIVADLYRLYQLQICQLSRSKAVFIRPPAPLLCHEGMLGRSDSHIRSKHTVIADRDLCLIQNHAIEVGIEVFANMNVFAIGAMEWTLNVVGISVHAAKELPDDVVALWNVPQRRFIQSVAVPFRFEHAPEVSLICRNKVRKMLFHLKLPF